MTVTLEELETLCRQYGVSFAVLDRVTVVYGDDCKEDLVGQAVLYGDVFNVLSVLDGLRNEVVGVEFTPFPANNHDPDRVIATIIFKQEVASRG